MKGLSVMRPLSMIRGTVMLIEENELFAEQMKLAMEEVHFNVTICTDARRVADCIQSDKPDLIIAEMIMHGADGLSLLLQLQRMGCKAPVILLSDKASAIDRVIGLRLGITDWMSKPIDLDELVARVQAVLRRVQPTSGTPGRRSESRGLVAAS